MNYRNLTTKELLLNASNKEDRGVLAPIAIELADRLSNVVSEDKYKELEEKLATLIRDYEIE